MMGLGVAHEPGSKTTGSEGRLDLGREVEPTHLRPEKAFEGSVSLDHGEGEVRTIFDGRGRQHEIEAGHSVTGQI